MRKALHKVGLYILFIGFLKSQIPEALSEIELANVELLALAAIAMALRVAAVFRNPQTQPQQ